MVPDEFLDFGKVFVGEVAFTDGFESLDYQAGVSAFDGKVLWNRAAEGDGSSAQRNLPGRPGGEEDCVHGHLRGEAEDVLGGGAGGDDFGIVPARDGLGNVLNGRIHQTEASFFSLEIDAARKVMEHPFLGQIGKDLADVFIIEFREAVVEEEGFVRNLLDPCLDDVDDFVFLCHKGCFTRLFLQKYR